MESILIFFRHIYRDKKLLLFFVFLISLFASLVFLLLFKNVGPSQHNTPGTDYLNLYKPVAQNLLEGKGFTKEGQLITRIPPGYPVFLTVVFGLSSFLRVEELQLIVFFNVFISALATCFLFLLVDSIFNKKIALISAILWASYPFNLWFIKNPNTEVPFVFFLYLGIWLYILAVKKRRIGFIFLAGVSIGLTSLIRPISMLLPLLLFLLVFFLLKKSSRKIKIFLALILLLGSLAAIIPWEGYILLKTGDIIPLSTNGPSSIVGGFTFALRSTESGERASVPGDVLVLMKQIKKEQPNSLAEVFRFFNYELRNRPISFFKLIGIKIARAWYATSQMWYEKEILTVQIFYLVFATLGLVPMLKKNKEKIGYIVLLLAIVFFFWGMTIIALSILRYMVPVMGLVLVFSAFSVEYILSLGWFKKENYAG